MINKENNKEENHENPVLPKSHMIDTALMDVQCHIVIRDSDSGEVLVNKRG